VFLVKKKPLASGTEFYRISGLVPISVAISKERKRDLASASFTSECRSIRTYIEGALNHYIANRGDYEIDGNGFDGTMTIFIDPKLRTQLRIEATSTGITLRKLAGSVLTSYLKNGSKVLQLG